MSRSVAVQFLSTHSKVSVHILLEWFVFVAFLSKSWVVTKVEIFGWDDFFG